MSSHREGDGRSRLEALIARLITGIVGWAAGVFYHIDRRGAPIPDGPVMVVANHPNSLLDPLVLFHTVGRVTRPLARAPLFDQAFLGTLLKGLGGLPVYRKEDLPDLMHLNDRTFTSAVAALHGGDAIQIYPEGRSHSEPSLVPMRTGAARIAMRAEEEAHWGLELRIVPVGLTYSRKTLFRGRVVAAIGEPFSIVSYREDYERDPKKAVRRLTDEIFRRLRRVTLNLPESWHRELVEVAERLYAREKGLTSWRDREELGRRLPRLQLFAEGLEWMIERDPLRLNQILRSVERYAGLVRLLGGGEADVPPRYPVTGLILYILRESLVLGIGLPLAVGGLAVWYLPYRISARVARGVQPAYETIATYKLVSAMAATVLYLGAWAFLSWLAWGIRAAVGMVIMLPVLGLAAIAWRERFTRVREDVALFIRVLRRPGTRDRLARERELLVREFDSVAAEMEAPGDTSD